MDLYRAALRRPHRHEGTMSVPEPLVTVVVPTRDRWRLLERTLTTVLAQRDVAFEVVVVDDGSRDDTPDRLSSIADPRLTVVREPVARGVAAARNRGLEVARGRWIAFADDDDLWAPDKLVAQVRAAESNPEAGWVVVGEVTIDSSLTVTGGRRPPRGREFREVLQYNIVPAGGSGTMARTELVRQVGGFNTELTVLADWDLWIRLFLAAPGVEVSRPLVAYLVHPTSMSHNSSAVMRELDVLISAYEHARRQHGVRFLHLIWLQWLCRMELQRGDRRRALRVALQAFGYLPELPAFLPLVVGGIRRRRPPRRWRREPDAWLSRLRRTTALPSTSGRCSGSPT
jgi:glycosyltransferase involved in cell wall biosynthesis